MSDISGVQQMNVVYCFIGRLPSYSIEQVHQLRLFYNGPAYFILNDYTNPTVEILKNKYNIQIIRYDSVINTMFKSLLQKTQHKFAIMHQLKGREKLFIHAFERFYVLYTLMLQYSLTNVLFPEIDNLIYDDPRNWMKSFENIDFGCLFDNYDRASGGISYIKHHDILQKILTSFNYYIETETGAYINEMSALCRFIETEQKNGNTRVSYLPTHWECSTYPPQTYENSKLFPDSVFDALSIGIYLAGIDLCHSNGVLKTKMKSPFGLIDYTCYRFDYKYDDVGRKIPYIYNGDISMRINNLHVHSKDLIHNLSSPL